MGEFHIIDEINKLLTYYLRFSSQQLEGQALSQQESIVRLSISITNYNKDFQYL